MNAFAASFYPTTSRASGMGLAFGVGRIGSILGPVLGGIILANNWTTSNVFLAVAVPALICAFAVWQVGMLKGHSGSDEQDVASASSDAPKRAGSEVASRSHVA